MEHRIFGIIPARGGSKGIPGKNLSLLGGKPLIAYTIEAALNSRLLSEVYVSTDDDEIARVSERFGAKIIRRPGSVSSDEIPVLPDVARHSVGWLESHGMKPEIIVMLQPTSPFRNSGHIDASIKKIFETNADWVATVSEAVQHPFRMRKLKGDRMLPLFENEDIYAQRQDLPKFYMMNGAVYVVRRDVLMKPECLESGDWRGVVIGAEDALDIDEPSDLLTAGTIIKRRERREDK